MKILKQSSFSYGNLFAYCKSVVIILVISLLCKTDIFCQLYTPGKDIQGNSGNNYVGIGTPNPTESLHVLGNSIITGLIKGGSQSSGTIDQSSSYPYPTIISTSADASNIQLISGSTQGNVSKIRINGGSDGNGIQFFTRNNEVLRIGDNGYIGIGTSAPTLGKVHIFQTGGTQLALESGDATGSADVVLKLKTAIDYRGRGIWMTYASSAGDWFAGVPYTGGGYSIGYHLNQPEYKNNSKLFISTSGNVGIGTVSPDAKLEVAGNIKLSTYAYEEFNIGNTKGYIWGNHDYSGSAGVFQDDLVLSSNWQGVTSNTDNFYNSSSFLKNAAISLGRYGIRFFTSDVSTAVPSERLSINSEGYIGIGTSTPSTILHIHNQNLGTGRITLSTAAANSETYSIGQGVLGISNGGFSIIDVTNNITRLSIQYGTGNVGIGVSSPGNYKLNVSGTIRANEVVVNTSGADYVFDSEYKLPDLSDIEKFVKENKHLPDIEAASEMQKDGMNMSEMQTKLLQKIEELTLYIIEQNKRIKSLEEKIDAK